MRDYLLFRLYGPLAAWGDIAVGEYRPSFAHPSKSAIIGLLAAALGIRRDEEDRQKSLAESCSFAVRVDSMGVLLRDYHTTQVPSTKKGVVHYTRRSELAADDLNTILSSRDYRCDAAYTVAITVGDGSLYTVQQLAAALLKPVFTLYLGRKSCPLAMPLQPQVINAATLREALESVPPVEELSSIVQKGDAMVFWEDDTASGLERQQVITRRDEPRSRKRWQFSERRENCGMLRKGEEPCTSA
jgi:CRISPR system Cascade subunit CasD